MSTRERWIVYPLLLLAVGAALRHQFVGFRELRAEHLICNELRAGHLACDRLESGQSECRAFLVVGPNGRPVVVACADPKSGSGVIETSAANGMPLVQIGSTGAAGIISVTGRLGQDFGLFARMPELSGMMIPLAPLRRHDGNRADQPPSGGVKKAPSPTKRPPEKPGKAEATKSGTNNREKGK
jgi:hypothetical protein